MLLYITLTSSNDTFLSTVIRFCEIKIKQTQEFHFFFMNFFFSRNILKNEIENQMRIINDILNKREMELNNDTKNKQENLNYHENNNENTVMSPNDFSNTVASMDSNLLDDGSVHRDNTSLSSTSLELFNEINTLMSDARAIDEWLIKKSEIVRNLAIRVKNMDWSGKSVISETGSSCVENTENAPNTVEDAKKFLKTSQDYEFEGKMLLNIIFLFSYLLR